jgi:hypothetical protein
MAKSMCANLSKQVTSVIDWLKNDGFVNHIYNLIYDSNPKGQFQEDMIDEMVMASIGTDPRRYRIARRLGWQMPCAMLEEFSSYVYEKTSASFVYSMGLSEFCKAAICFRDMEMSLPHVISSENVEDVEMIMRYPIMVSDYAHVVASRIGGDIHKIIRKRYQESVESIVSSSLPGNSPQDH